MHRLILFFLLSLPRLLHGQNVKDTFEVSGPNYTGYIVPLTTWNDPLSWPVSSKVRPYRPPQAEIQKAEVRLAAHLDSICSHPVSWNDSADCPTIKKSFSSYFRQYGAYISKDGHKHVIILCVSPQMQASLDAMKKGLMNGISDGGPVLFHADIDLNIGKVSFHDNGWG